MGGFCFLQKKRCPGEGPHGQSYVDIKEKERLETMPASLLSASWRPHRIYRKPQQPLTHPPAPSKIHHPSLAEHRRCRRNHPLCMEQHAQRRCCWSLFSPAPLLPALISRGSGRRGPSSCGKRREITGRVTERAVISQPSQTADRPLLLAHNPVCLSLTCSCLFISSGGPFRTLPPRPAVIPDHESLKLPP